jgi:exportin-5
MMGLLQLLLLITQSQSLIVSIPVLVTWTRLLNHSALGPNIAATPAVIGPLLEVCSARLIRYESLPEDSEDPTLRLLFEDTDTVPERHAFLGNYRRYSSQVIETIVYLKISDAMQHILGQTENVLAHLYDDSPSFSSEEISELASVGSADQLQWRTIQRRLNLFCESTRRLQSSKQLLKVTAKESLNLGLMVNRM